ncbi:CAAX prenyl protease 2 isoform X2 [Triticum urartu]|uniref:CAAX prenyl protease 2 isoform X2 n=1 Tax=Triticum urartu TaxID=4572 RepID=UPI002044CA05|nr:CAAX prenyl protease 2 isoform X2 [Triticum urartu]
MATPAGSHPASPPAIPGKAAGAACAAMAVSYVAVLYAPTLLLRLPPATSLRAFFHRRFVCAAVSSAASVLATAALLGVWSLSDSSKALAVFGIRSDHLLEAVVIPLLLTSLVYAGSFVARLWVMSSSCGTDDDGVGVSCTEKLARWMQTSLQDVMVWRNYVVAPFTEELVFRACMIPLLLCGGFKMYNIIFLSPIFFSLGVQLGYTVIFGWYAAFLFIRTGNLVPPIVAHILCNMMGLPAFSSPRTRGVTSLAFLAGSVSFFCLLFPATSPKLYNARLDGCSCWHGYCRWS